MKESLFRKNEEQKTYSFRKNDRLNELIAELKNLLSPVQKQKVSEFNENKWPISLIVGSPRSGTTLLLQWMASLGVFSYPSNFLTRFAYAPYIGALIQKMIFDKRYDFHGEFSDVHSEINFSSYLGKSKGALATNEFQHFFRFFMPNFDPEFLDDAMIKKVDFEGIKRGLASIEYAFGKPFVTKAFMLQYNIKGMISVIPRTLIIFIKREPLFNMQSILLARKSYYRDVNIWWSFKPKEYEFIKDMDVYHQIAGQVYFTNMAIENQLKDIPSEKQITIKYEQFCRMPEFYFNKIKDIYSASGYVIKSYYQGTGKFEVQNYEIPGKDDTKRLEKAYEYFISESHRSL